MIDANLTRLLFIFAASSIAVVSFLLHNYNNYLPVSIKKTLKYGKHAEKKQHVLVSKLEVPKRWFGHFYIFSAPVSALTLIIVINRYFYNGELSNTVCWLLDLQLGSSRKPLVSPEDTLVALFLLTIQCWKRFYETQCVSIFSDSKINISHYVIGYVHYIGALTCIIGESQGFTKANLQPSANFQWNHISRINFIWMAIFLLASYAQLRANIIFAKLRKNKDNYVDSKSHKIPHGELFEYISAPLQFTEIIMYLMLTFILWDASTFHFIFIWVFVNQTETAVSTHEWYHDTFKDQYPKDRKIYIPFIV
ncbi:hypothetical protein HCN44_010821 [Aphidius gifuensis]|uniref:Polyprenal reductase n=1 Tax=Aphidius gifuensis TaxID=684658 RepID=A0A834XTM4_APHGI|nr:polyprenol reductase isoform X2 [Aphidius gifuensis]KAF7992001.1 hypothetical protein HCN44_010821 [Aphidius gifuensis]